jgi:hypothetical protein
MHSVQPPLCIGRLQQQRTVVGGSAGFLPTLLLSAVDGAVNAIEDDDDL